MAEDRKLDIIVPFWKPIDWTSFDVVKKVRYQIKPNKVGHAGTLDPFAEGVLVLCIGKKTRESQSIMNLEKEYIGIIQLGTETDTLDTTGKVISKMPVPALSYSLIEKSLVQFIGDIEQVPPMYSALKKSGQPLYRLARKGITVEREPRMVHISNIEIIEIQEDKFSIKVICGKGTYIRSLASDISKALGTCGYLKSLTRTRVGQYDENNSVKLDEMQEWLDTLP